MPSKPDIPAEATEWIPTEWVHCDDLTADGPLITIGLMVSHLYEGRKFAVRKGRNCLNKDGLWEYEPMSSRRDDAFYARCRFDSFDDAAAAIAALNPKRIP